MFDYLCGMLTWKTVTLAKSGDKNFKDAIVSHICYTIKNPIQTEKDLSKTTTQPVGFWTSGGCLLVWNKEFKMLPILAHKKEVSFEDLFLWHQGNQIYQM